MIRPRRLAHRGTVAATGFVIATSLVGVEEARRRVLALWTPGARVLADRDHYVITGLRACRIRTSAAPGAPLVEQHGVLAAMPLESDEANELAGAVVVARGGVAEPLALDRELDVASWIDLDELQVVEPASLAAAPIRVALPPPPSSDVRSVTGAPPAGADVVDMTAALTRVRTGTAARPGTPSRWQRFVQWFAARLAPRQKALAGPEQAPELSVLDRLRSRIAEALWKSRLGNALGRRHAAYLRRMLDLFDRGELDEALRHAIPIGGGGDNTRLRLGVPRPRQDLSLTFGARTSSSVIPVVDVAMAMMRDRYRAAAARLEQGGRIDEAAFVLAELLGDVKAAIALLERHERYAIAARLGEGRDLEPGLVVRLWFLAGDRRRAIDIARKHHAWADAVARLERSGDKQAAVLRMLWADHLAETGDFVRAVEAAWPTSSRSLVEAWIDRGIASEGRAAARLLVKKLIVAPASFPAVAPALLGLLGGSDHERVRERIAMIEELVASPTSPELQTIARPALRALVHDCGTGAEGATSDLLDRLVKFADDAALRADRPSIAAAPKPPRLVGRELHWATHDGGILPVYDAAILPGDRVLLALGELGVRIIGRTGRTIAHIDQPASRLVVSDHGTRALAIAPRGQVQRIARLDLVDRRGTHWCDAELDGATPTFDGDLWLVTRGREVFAVDTTASRWRAVWGIAVDPETARCSIRREGRWFAIEVRDGVDLELWHYEGFTLRTRKPWGQVGSEYVAARPTKGKAFVVRDPDDVIIGDVAAIELAGDHAVVVRRAAEGLSVGAMDLSLPRPLATFVLEGATAASVRLADQMLVLGDDRGRVIVFDLVAGVIRRELRTT